MAVQELDKFRAKFPGYNDLSDQELAAKLSKRYPEYADLPSLVLDGTKPDYQRPDESTLGNIFDRPAAAVRGGIQALPSGGETPFQGYTRGANYPQSVPTFQSQALDQYYQGISRLHPDQPPSFGESLMGNVPSALGMAADLATNPANLLLAMAPGAPGVRQGLQALGRSPAGQAVGQFMTKERSFRPKLTTVDEVLAVPQARLPKLTQEQRQVYFRARSQQTAEQFAQQRLTLRSEQEAIQRELGKSAQRRSIEIRQQLPQLYAKQSAHYRDLVDAELAPVANEQVTDGVLRSYLKQRFVNNPERLAEVSGKLGIINEVKPDPTIPEPTFKLGELYRKALDFGQELPRAVRAGARVYSPTDVVTDDTISALVDFLDTQGVSLKEARSFWKSWAPIRDQSAREFKPFLITGTQTGAGSGRLMRLAQGIDPDNAVYAKELSRLLEIDSLPQPLVPIVRKLTANQKSQAAMTLQQKLASGELDALKFQVSGQADKYARKMQMAYEVLKLIAGGTILGTAIQAGRRVAGP